MTTDERLARLERKVDYLTELLAAFIRRHNVDEEIKRMLREAPTLAPVAPDLSATNGE